MKKAWVWVTGTIACALLACRGQIVNLGSNDGGSSSGATSGAAGSGSGGGSPTPSTVLVQTEQDGDGGGGTTTTVSWSSYYVAVGSTSVYFTGEDDNNVLSVPKIGGTGGTVAYAPDRIAGLAADATSLYWTFNSFGLPPGKIVGALMKMPLGGGTPVTLASGPGYAGAVVVDATNVYWVDDQALMGPDNTYVVLQMPVSGGTPVTLATPFSPYEDVDPVAAPVAVGLAVDTKNVYWTNPGTPGAVMTVPIGGGTPTTLATDPNLQGAPLPFFAASVGLAVDDTGVYWSDNGMDAGATLMKVPLGGGTPATIAVAPPQGDTGGMTPTITAIATDGTNVYWTCLASTAGVMRMPKTGGTPAVLATGNGLAMALDDTYVYWAGDEATGWDGIIKTPK